MRPEGIKSFQEDRGTITEELVQKAADNLVKKHVNISGRTIFIEYQKLFKKKNLGNKYFVSEQTISRNTRYSSIWQDIKKKINIENKLKKTNTKNQEAFSLRDQYDLLKQDYIELLDEFKLIEKAKKEQEEEIKKLKTMISTKEIYQYEDIISKKHPSEIINSIKSLLLNGMVVIIKKDNKIIFKNNNLNDDNRIEIQEEEWNNI